MAADVLGLFLYASPELLRRHTQDSLMVQSGAGPCAVILCYRLHGPQAESLEGTGGADNQG